MLKNVYKMTYGSLFSYGCYGNNIIVYHIIVFNIYNNVKTWCERLHSKVTKRRTDLKLEFEVRSHLCMCRHT